MVASGVFRHVFKRRFPGLKTGLNNRNFIVDRSRNKLIRPNSSINRNRNFTQPNSTRRNLFFCANLRANCRNIGNLQLITNKLRKKVRFRLVRDLLTPFVGVFVGNGSCCPDMNENIRYNYHHRCRPPFCTITHGVLCLPLCYQRGDYQRRRSHSPRGTFLVVYPPVVVIFPLRRTESERDHLVT